MGNQRTPGWKLTLMLCALLLPGIGLSGTARAESAPYRPIPLEGLKKQFRLLDGQRVQVAGRLAYLAEMLYISDPTGFSPVPVQFHKLPHEQYKALLDSCRPRCAGVVSGVAAVDHMLGDGEIIADNIDFAEALSD
jgi:hypothetical protein